MECITKAVTRFLVWGFFTSLPFLSFFLFRIPLSFPSFPFPPIPSSPPPNPARGLESAVSSLSGALAANAFWGYFEARKRFWFVYCSFSGDKIAELC